ncbi:MAG: 2,3-bisphosphoglycerate-independent phosphoglycerate mutase [Gemmatimonadaceae bacterium]|nr:2,3-bisphosphoglycerate-independent phosphoglycerate mutase [Gemmatimonadaceae bacterium]
MSGKRKPVALIVLDGWGYRADSEGNAIALANTPTWDRLWGRGSKTLLEASGLRVGLPPGQMGNSEVGHLNLGAGRVVMQDLVRISASIADGSLFRNTALRNACDYVKATGGTLHLMGLIGSGGVHAIDEHLFALLDLAEYQKVPSTVVHAFVDGRDTLPKSGLGFMQELVNQMARRGSARVGSVSGRYYAMDRDRRWQRTELAYRAIVAGSGLNATDPLEVIRKSYEAGITDEFILPTAIVSDGVPVGQMRDGDAVICFNYRSDRMRQIVRTLIDPAFDGFGRAGQPEVKVITLTMYDEKFKLPVAFEPFSMSRIVSQVLSERGKTILKTAETEKYPHVTYFFNGGLEPPYPGEERVLVASPKVATYDLMPEMSAPALTDSLCAAIENNQHDFVLCNFANADMVGHSGSIPATLKAVETVDACLARILQSADKTGMRLLITADHGNAEQMIDPLTGGPHTAHTTSPVPFVVVDPIREHALRVGGALCDVAPTILSMLGVEQPAEMTGANLGVFD